MRYEQALKMVFQRRKCGLYGPADVWPPCCDECGCAEEAKTMTEQKITNSELVDIISE